MVDQCEDGYDWDISEFHNDIGCRHVLEKILESDDLKKFNEYVELKISIEIVDIRFKRITEEFELTGKEEYWWQKAVLKRAGSAYASYFEKDRHIKIEVI